MSATYIVTLFFILLCTTVLFFVAQKKKDNSIIDIAYGLSFVLVAWILAILKINLTTLPLHSAVLLLLITIWGSRLSYRIYQKNKEKPEDFRYKTWRETWMKKGKLYYFLRAYLQIFILQGIIISLVLLPFTLTIDNSFTRSSMLLFGVLVWIVGFCFEAVGDYQLDRFITSKSEHKGTIMKTGLWKYTRHPNYFGESTMWFGIAFIALSSGASLYVLLSPLLITFLLLFVSGIPMIEKRWQGLPEWEVYKKKTSAFIPLPPKK